MITINPAGSHRSCNCCGSDVEVVEVMFNNDKTGRGIEVALCVECMNNLVNAVLKRVVKVYTTNELNYCTSDLVYIEERGESKTCPLYCEADRMIYAEVFPISPLKLARTSTDKLHSQQAFV